MIEDERMGRMGWGLTTKGTRVKRLVVLALYFSILSIDLIRKIGCAGVR